MVTLPGPLVIGDQPLAPSTTVAALREAVARFNADTHRFNRDLDELQTLNPRWLSADEVELFVAELARRPAGEREALAARPLDLSSPALKLYCADGFGGHGLRRPWTLVAADGGWAIVPVLDAEDVVADLAIAVAAESTRQRELDAATTQLLASAPGTPPYSAAFGAEARARARLTWVQRAAVALLDQLGPALAATGVAHGYSVERVDRERARLDAALSGAPAGGGIGLPGAGR